MLAIEATIFCLGLHVQPHDTMWTVVQMDKKELSK